MPTLKINQHHEMDVISWNSIDIYKKQKIVKMKVLQIERRMCFFSWFLILFFLFLKRLLHFLASLDPVLIYKIIYNQIGIIFKMTDLSNIAKPLHGPLIPMQLHLIILSLVVFQIEKLQFQIHCNLFFHQTVWFSLHPTY